jgi:tellurite resistance protein
MSNSSPIVELPAGASSRLAAAVQALTPTDDSARLQAVLELGYLAASADGLDASERDTLASLLEAATGEFYDHHAFELHFADLDQAVEIFGRRERLARTTADLEDDAARADAIRFAALVAMADGRLHAPELAVLVEAGAYFAWDAARVRELVDDAAARVTAAGGGAR